MIGIPTGLTGLNTELPSIVDSLKTQDDIFSLIVDFLPPGTLQHYSLLPKSPNGDFLKTTHSSNHIQDIEEMNRNTEHDPVKAFKAALASDDIIAEKVIIDRVLNLPESNYTERAQKNDYMLRLISACLSTTVPAPEKAVTIARMSTNNDRQLGVLLSSIGDWCLDLSPPRASSL